jgi:hypothetical protein
LSRSCRIDGIDDDHVVTRTDVLVNPRPWT